MSDSSNFSGGPVYLKEQIQGVQSCSKKMKLQISGKGGGCVSLINVKRLKY